MIARQAFVCYVYSMRLGAFLLLFFLATNPTVQPKRNGDQTHAQADSRTQTPVVAVNNGSTEAKASDGEKKVPKWDASVWANWALVAVGLITFWAIWWQAKKTAEATQAMQRSIALQKAQSEQWLVIQDWSNSRVVSSHGHPTQLLVGCNIVNPTNFPLRLTEYSVRADDQPYTHSIPHLLAPNVPFAIDFTINLTPAADDAYQANFWFFWIHLNIRFTDVLRDNRSQEFTGKLIVYRNGTRFHPHSVSGEFQGNATGQEAN